MKTLNDSIQVHVPIYEAYNQWTQFETFPRFMEHLREVRQLDDRHVQWHAKVDGHDVEWDSEITEQIPDEIISWKSITGPEHSGYVEFQPVSRETTRIDVQVNYEPGGILDRVDSSIDIDSVVLHRQLERFKSFIEQRRHATGAWRGTINTPGGQTS